MRKTRPSAFDPTYKGHPVPKPEMVNLGDAIPIQSKAPLAQKAVSPPSPVKQTTSGDTVIPWYHDTTVENIRKSVKQFGKEAATHRFTKAEKQKVIELVYIYSGKGIRTSENEITRIAVNFLIEDHKHNEDNSVLDQVLKLLNS